MIHDDRSSALPASRLVVARWLLPGLLVVVLTACQAPGMGSGIAGGDWYRYQSSHFVVYSRLPESLVAERIRHLEAFRALTHRILELKERRSFGHTTKLLLLGSTSQLRTLFGMQRQVVGFMRPGLRENLLVATETGSRALVSENHTTFHEYVHYLTRNASAIRYPPWYDEGLAELLAATEIEQGTAVLGSVFPGAAYSLVVDPLGRTRSSQGPSLHIEELIEVERFDDHGSMETIRLYANAWLLVHYLTLSETARDGLRQRMVSYLAEYDAGNGGVPVFEETLGMTIAELEAELIRYTRGIPSWQVPLGAIDDGYQHNRLQDHAIAHELASMAAPSNPGYARQLYSSILEAHPDDARALAGLGFTYQVEHDYAAAEPRMRRALALDDGDYTLYTELADLLQIRCAARVEQRRCPDAATNDEAAGLYRTAYELNPESAETLFNYGRSLLDSRDPELALPLLKKAHELLPSAYTVVLHLGIAHAANGDLTAARSQLHKAQGWTVDYPEEQAYVKSLLSRLATAESATEPSGS